MLHLTRRWTQRAHNAAYNGRQAYIVEAKVVGGRVISATMGLIAGGKDAAIVVRMCAKYGLSPNNAI